MIGYGRCPRCGRWAMEHLNTHSHCWECNFFPEEDFGHRAWSLLEFRLPSFVAQRKAAHMQASRDRIGADEVGIPYEYERDLMMPIRGIL